MTKLYNIKETERFRRKLRTTMPKGEVVLWKYLRGKQLGHKFRRQYSIGSSILDFYCPELRLNIEVDGVPISANKQQNMTFIGKSL